MVIRIVNDRMQPSVTHLGSIRRIHFVGIGGAGMSGIAEVLVNQGYHVSGSDLYETPTTQRLQQMGATIWHDHHSSYVDHADVLVYSSAVLPHNPELLAARARKIPVIPRAVMLGELMRFRHGIAVAGTHGKTTTTSLISHILGQAGLDPTFVVGGRINGMGMNARLGTGQFIVAEADESDASFLYLKPMHAVVTNIDNDHMEAYHDDFNRLSESFLHFLHQLPFYGLAVLCMDDPVVAGLVPKLNCRVLTYGFHPTADVNVTHMEKLTLGTQFTVQRFKKNPLKVELQLPGRHNVANACAAIGLATDLGISDQHIQGALASFKGVARRFQIFGEFTLSNQRKIIFIDDYGHHPTEIEATVAAVKMQWPNRRLMMVFQPHRYSRTTRLMSQFASVLSSIDHLVILDIYSAGEPSIPEVNSERLCNEVKRLGKNSPIYVKDEATCFKYLEEQLQDGDVLVTQGAGSIGQMAQRWSNHFNTVPFEFSQHQ